MTHRIRRTRRTIHVPRKGMTLIEVMVALCIAMIALLGFGTFLMKFMHTSSNGTLASAASDIAVSQIEAAKSYPTYTSIPTAFNGTKTGYTNCYQCTLVTKVTQTSNTTENYMTVTATVTAPNLSSAVTKTTVIASF